MMKANITKVTSHISHNEALIFERSQTGRIGYRLPALDVDERPLDELLLIELMPGGRPLRRAGAAGVQPGLPLVRRLPVPGRPPVVPAVRQVEELPVLEEAAAVQHPGQAAVVQANLLRQPG